MRTHSGYNAIPSVNKKAEGGRNSGSGNRHGVSGGGGVSGEAFTVLECPEPSSFEQERLELLGPQNRHPHAHQLLKHALGGKLAVATEISLASR